MTALDTIKITVMLFGHYRDFAPDAGRGMIPLEVSPDTTIADVAEMLERIDARFKDIIHRTRVAIGAEIERTETVVRDGDIVAFLPPMSGG